MANGDVAAGAGMDVVPSTAPRKMGYDEINKTRDYIVTKASSTPPDGSITTAKIVDGAVTNPKLGTGSVSARVLQDGQIIAAKFAAGAVNTAALANDLGLHNVSAKLGARVAFSSPVEGTRLELSSHLYVPNASPVSTGYVAAYINSDGRLGKSASSRRYKKNIRNARILGSLFGVRLREFQMREADDGVYHVGHVAEELAENDATARFVVHDADGNPDAFDAVALLQAQVYELNARLAVLEARADSGG